MTEAGCQHLTISGKEGSVSLLAVRINYHSECFNLQESGAWLIGYKVLGTK